MNTINKYIKHLSLFFIIVGLIVSAGTVEIPQKSPYAITFNHDASPLPGNDNLWDRLRAEFHINHATQQTLVQTHRTWYLNNPDYIEKVFSRAEPYLYYIAEELEARGLPKEFILIPVIESDFNPMARSRVGATGIWQLMAATARAYGIVQNGAYDGRRDIHVSTEAALEHLTHLSKLYNNDWHLVLAAYNWGEGNLNRAIRRNERAGLATDFWSLTGLPKETLNYVPKIMALADVVKNHQRLDVEIPAVADEPQIAVVDIDVETYIDLTIAANLADLETEELREINPGITQTTMTHSPQLMMPIEKVDAFQEALENYSPPVKKAAATAPVASTHATSQYVVKSGDTLNQIAKTHGVSASVLQQHNNLATTTLQIGQMLRIPRGA